MEYSYLCLITVDQPCINKYLYALVHNYNINVNMHLNLRSPNTAKSHPYRSNQDTLLGICQQVEQLEVMHDS